MLDSYSLTQTTALRDEAFWSVQPVVSRRYHTGLSLAQEEFEALSAFILRELGIYLERDKRSFVEGRLENYLLARGFRSFGEYYEALVTASDASLLGELADRISTNYTYFYREFDHFDFLMRLALPEAIEASRQTGKKTLRLWSCGCSSGEESYLLAILMLEALGEEAPLWDTGVLGTDISSEVLAKARLGIYRSDQIARLPAALAAKYFVRNGNGLFQVVDAIRKEVLYRRLNLMASSFPLRQPFDIVFCRNVMLYFDGQVREALLEKLAEFVRPGGYLVVGLSERIGKNLEGFRWVGPSIYKRKS